ncbi:MAG TPA: alpha/beta hydrolase domain-containing protein [Polyangiaceae bacterium]|nr:alpha/beta hydrolase domain-containing protein [Polyangiaceae bacterium]
MQRVVCSPKLLLPAFVLLLACGCSTEKADKNTGSNPTMGADAATPKADGATVPVTVTGPITGGRGKPFSTSIVDLGANGYGEREFFYEGDAIAYALQGEMTMDGKWTLLETSKESYKSRMIVRRPTDAAKFNGTVVVEWLNVSGGADGDPGFMYNWQEILREGYVWVGVSAQATGIEGGGFSVLPNPPPPLKVHDPERYGSLRHPGDAYSFDIYTRAAQVVRGASGVDVLDGLEPKRLIAYGESQSAMRLVSYVNGVHPSVKAFDGFFIHSRSVSGVPFTNDAMLSLGGPPVFIRDDIEAFVFQFQTETDVLGLLGYLRARQPDSDRLRTWEVAGTAHADAYIQGINGDAGSALACADVNDGPQHFVIKAALHALHLWMTDGTAPVKGDLLMGNDGSPATDDNGNVLGGVRTPDVDVPIATLSGLAPAGSNILCSLFGHTTPFTPEKLIELYPTHETYVMKVKDSARKSAAAKFILEPEEQAMVAEAETAPVPK